MKIDLESLSYHRNGISGIGFHVLIGRANGERMLIVRVPPEVDKRAGGVACAVFDLDKLNAGDIAFGSNREAADQLIAAHEKEVQA